MLFFEGSIGGFIGEVGEDGSLIWLRHIEIQGEVDDL